MNTKALKAKRLTVLEETVNHFNSNTRCQNGKGCQYSPIKGKSDGCAIGRLIKDKKICAELDKIGSIGLDRAFKKLPRNLKTLGQAFLIDLQHLHDSSVCWNEGGLTEYGLVKYNAIKVSVELEYQH